MKNWIAAALAAALATLVLVLACKPKTELHADVSPHKLPSFIPVVPANVAVDMSVLAPDGGTPYPSGTFAYVYGGMAIPTDNATAMSAQPAGVYEGASGFLQTGVGIGITDAQFTAQGGKPQVGQVVWVANGADDNGTGAGKLTATMPQRVVQNFGVSGSDRFNYPQNVVEAFRVTDNSGYLPSCDGGVCSCASPATCTAKGVVLAPRMIRPDQNPPSGTRWQTSGLGGFTTSNYLSAAFNVSGAKMNDGDVLVITWSHVYSALGYTLIGNKDGSGNGREIQYQSGNTCFFQWQAGSAGGTLCFGVNPGTHRLVVAVHNTLLRGVLDNGPIVTAASGAIANAASGSMTLGKGTYGATPGTIYNVARLFSSYDAGPGISDREMSAWASAIVPQTLTETNRIMLPESLAGVGGVGAHPDLLWAYEPTFLSNPLNANGAGSPVFTWTTNGSPLGITHIERWISGTDLCAIYQGTGTCSVDGLGVTRVSPAAQIAYTSQAQDAGAGQSSEQEVALAWYSEAQDNADQIIPGFAYNDAGGNFLNYAGPISPTTGLMGWQAPQASWQRKNIKLAWVGHDPGGDAPVVSQLMQLQNGLATELHSPGFGAHYGAFLYGIIVTDGQVFTSPVAAAKALVFVGDNMLLGDNCTGSPVPAQASCAPVNMARATYPTSGGPGVVHAVVRQGEQSLLPVGTGLPGLAVNGSMKPAAQNILDECTHEGATTCQIVHTIDGYWEFLASLASTSPTAFGNAYGALLDAEHALCTQLGITCPIFLAEGPRTYNTSTNGQGFTYANYRTTVAGLTTDRAWLTVFDSNSPTNVSTHFSGDWLTYTGATNWHSNIKAAVGGWRHDLHRSELGPAMKFLPGMRTARPANDVDPFYEVSGW